MELVDEHALQANTQMNKYSKHHRVQATPVSKAIRDVNESDSRLRVVAEEELALKSQHKERLLLESPGFRDSPTMLNSEHAFKQQQGLASNSRLIMRKNMSKQFNTSQQINPSFNPMQSPPDMALAQLHAVDL